MGVVTLGGLMSHMLAGKVKMSAPVSDVLYKQCKTVSRFHFKEISKRIVLHPIWPLVMGTIESAIIMVGSTL